MAVAYASVLERGRPLIHEKTPSAVVAQPVIASSIVATASRNRYLLAMMFSLLSTIGAAVSDPPASRHQRHASRRGDLAGPAAVACFGAAIPAKGALVSPSRGRAAGVRPLRLAPSRPTNRSRRQRSLSSTLLLTAISSRRISAIAPVSADWSFWKSDQRRWASHR